MAIGSLATPSVAVDVFAKQRTAEDVSWVWHSANIPEGTKMLAVLLDHIEINGQTENIRKRRRSLYVHPGVVVTTVVHVQMAPSAKLQPTPKQTRLIVDSVLAASDRSTSGWVQLDFEVTRAMATYYVDLVGKIRRELPPDRRLSVTTQAHWCLDANLIAEISADEIVPMFFHTGDPIQNWWQRFESDSKEMSPRCLTGAAGFAVQESPPAHIATRFERRYWFSYVAWKS